MLLFEGRFFLSIFRPKTTSVTEKPDGFLTSKIFANDGHAPAESDSRREVCRVTVELDAEARSQYN